MSRRFSHIQTNLVKHAEENLSADELTLFDSVGRLVREEKCVERLVNSLKIATRMIQHAYDLRMAARQAGTRYAGQRESRSQPWTSRLT